MKLNLNNLIEAIENATERLSQYSESFGIEEPLTLSVYDRLRGLEEAFEVLTGTSYFDYTINQIKERSLTA